MVFALCMLCVFLCAVCCCVCEMGSLTQVRLDTYIVRIGTRISVSLVLKVFSSSREMIRQHNNWQRAFVYASEYVGAYEL